MCQDRGAYLQLIDQCWLTPLPSTANAGQGRNSEIAVTWAPCSAASRTLKLLQLHRLRSDIDIEIEIDDRAAIVIIIVIHLVSHPIPQAALIAVGAAVQ
ncbi:hypothetical protein ACLKA7_011882 [Drosophila subpalustris]